LGEGDLLEAKRVLMVRLRILSFNLQVYAELPEGWTEEERVIVGRTICAYYLGLEEEKPALAIPAHLLSGIKQVVKELGDESEIPPSSFSEVDDYITRTIESHYTNFLDSF
jgi:hypothetical protein